jgi:hypothetical protein
MVVGPNEQLEDLLLIELKPSSEHQSRNKRRATPKLTLYRRLHLA